MYLYINLQGLYRISFYVFIGTNVVVGDENGKLPFQCPYQIPDDLPQPSKNGNEGGGLFPIFGEEDDLDTGTSDVYGQYRAALALVPCDARAISVFTTPLIDLSHTVSVIFVYDKPVQELKKWLE